jgi:hypothetical protein
VFASIAVIHGFNPWPGQTKDKCLVWFFWVKLNLLKVFFISVWDHIIKSVGIPLTGLALPQFFTCPRRVWRYQRGNQN